jgi:hypothetical protein
MELILDPAKPLSHLNARILPQGGRTFSAVKHVLTQAQQVPKPTVLQLAPFGRAPALQQAWHDADGSDMGTAT